MPVAIGARHGHGLVDLVRSCAAEHDDAVVVTITYIYSDRTLATLRKTRTGIVSHCSLVEWLFQY